MIILQNTLKFQLIPQPFNFTIVNIVNISLKIKALIKNMLNTIFIIQILTIQKISDHHLLGATVKSHKLRYHRINPYYIRTFISQYYHLLPWVRGIVVLNVECEFRGRSSNSSVCHDHVMLTLGKSTLPQPNGGLLLDQQCAIEEVSINWYI